MFSFTPHKCHEITKRKRPFAIQTLRELKTTLIIVLFASFIFLKNVNAKDIDLPLPQLSQEAVIGYKAGFRPCRINGIRLEHEYFCDKLIIHDYGHGGSGISLSWGSALISLDILQQELMKGFIVKDQLIAVLGSGIIGLTTAHLLADAGWKVQIYASRFPPHTTSDIAPGLWGRVFIGERQDKAQEEMTLQILKLSHKEFLHLSKVAKPRFRGVSPLIIYSFKEMPTINNLPPELVPKEVPVNVKFRHGISKNGHKLRSLLIDTTIYIPDLVKKAKKRGIEFIRTTFQAKEDLLQLPHSIIFNCTGLGSKQLFGDDNLFAIKGELIELNKQAGLRGMLSGPLKGFLDLYLIPLKDKCILGGSYENSALDENPDPMICEEILEHARAFFRQSINDR